jgi:hypothetical protein
MDGWMDEWIMLDGWMDGWIRLDGWMDGATSHGILHQNRSLAAALCIERAFEADKARNPTCITTTSHQMLQQNRSNATALRLERARYLIGLEIHFR